MLTPILAYRRFDIQSHASQKNSFLLKDQLLPTSMETDSRSGTPEPTQCLANDDPQCIQYIVETRPRSCRKYHAETLVTQTYILAPRLSAPNRARDSETQTSIILVVPVLLCLSYLCQNSDA